MKPGAWGQLRSPGFFLSTYTRTPAMRHLRTHGDPPYHAAVIHGGPGARGSVAPVARELVRTHGVLEPLQTEHTIGGQVRELADILRDHADGPATLIGHSWGAWLAWIVAARHPNLVAKLILVGSGPFEAHYAEQIMPARLARLSESERAEFDSLIPLFSNPDAPGRDEAMSRIGGLIGQADTYAPLPPEPEPDPIDGDSAAFAGIWPAAAEMRASGELLALARDVRCPVVAIHGDHDPHPYDGVREPLERALADSPAAFRPVLLEKCGHEPWRERHAREAFYAAVRGELG